MALAPFASFPALAPFASKTVFMGHRRWLRDDDPWRKRKDPFDGETEPRRRPRTRSGEEIDELFKNWKDCPLPGKKQKAPVPVDGQTNGVLDA